ncbi:hypothetical protein RRG08_006332 [Elysia crispata]|uniref:Uncharacterized protein n=1 Tax=Elysia crispata TaxID=231223 RepID=A0AAE0YPV2_9GAST|nr:hypothetical protein RRG08_006332 [Elysia crispata]
MELEENVQAYVDAIVESWPTSTPRLQTLRHETARDPELQKVSHYVMTGWPSKIPEDLQHYQQYQCSISINLKPITSDRTDMTMRLKDSHAKMNQKRRYDERRGAQQLPDLPLG